MLRAAAAALSVLALAAGCGGGEHGKATVWVTRDEGRTLLLSGTVPAGLTAMQGLERLAKVKTSYGGRFVDSIAGLGGSRSGQRDWFYFVNGVEGDRGAAEYRLHDGDVEWWDLRSWAREPRVPVVVGAFPEPFRHGYGGRRHAAAVRYAPASARPAAERIGRLIGARSVRPAGSATAAGESTFTIVPRPTPFRAWGGARGPWHFVIGAREATLLARRPVLARYRYRGLR
jgi:Domain of unknown function (DUF4430)